MIRPIILFLMVMIFLGIGPNSYAKSDSPINNTSLNTLDNIKQQIEKLHSKNPEVVDDAIMTLVGIGEPALEPLINSLNDEEHSFICKVIWVLGEIKDPRAVDSLIHFLKNENPNIRDCAAWALGGIGDIRSVEPLIPLLQDKEVGVRIRAAGALNMLEDPRAVEPLILALKDKEDSVRINAALGLGKIKDPRAIKPLINVFKDTGADSYLLSEIAQALAWIGKPAVEPLIDALNDTSPTVREGAIRALGMIQDSRATKFMIEALNDKDFYVRKAAEWVLSRMQDKQSIEVLISAFKEKGAAFRERIKYILALAGKAHASLLITLLTDKDPDIRKNVAWILGQLKDSIAVEPLIKILQDKDYGIRRNVALALGKIEDWRSVKYLIDLLNDENWSIQLASALALRSITGMVLGYDPALWKRWLEKNKDNLQEAISRIKQSTGYIPGIGYKKFQMTTEFIPEDFPSDVRTYVEKLFSKEIEERENGVVALGKMSSKAAVATPFLIELLDEGSYVIREDNIKINPSEKAIDTLVILGEPAVRSLLFAALENKSSTGRKHAVSALAKIQDTRIAKFLFSALKFEDLDVQKYAAEALGEIKDPGTVDLLMTYLNDNNPNLRENVVFALGKIDDVKPVENLISALKDDDKDVRKSAARALGEIKDFRAVEPLIGVLNDRYTDVQKNAAWALGEIKDLRAVEPLITAINTQIRCQAVEALAKTKDPRAVEPLISVLHSDFGVWGGAGLDEAIKGLEEIDDPRTIEPLRNLLQKNPSRDKIEALIKKKDPQLVETLISLLDNIKNLNGTLEGYQNRKRKENILWGLGETRDSRAVKPLITALKEGDAGIQYSAQKALIRIGKDSVGSLVSILDSKVPVPGLKVLSINALGEIKDLHAVEPLIAAFKDTDRFIKLDISGALRKIGEPAVEPLIAALKNEDPDIREAVAMTLGYIKDPRATSPLIASFKGRRIKLAASAISKIGKPAVKALTEALKDDNVEVREQAAFALELIGDPSVVEPLISALKDKDWSVRAQAAIGLRRLKDPRAVEPLIICLEDRDLHAREWELKALRDRIMETLGVITGRDFGNDQNKWLEWREKNKKQFK